MSLLILFNSNYGMLSADMSLGGGTSKQTNGQTDKWNIESALGWVKSIKIKKLYK